MNEKRPTIDDVISLLDTFDLHYFDYTRETLILCAEEIFKRAGIIDHFGLDVVVLR